MSNSINISWGRIVGTATGSALAGPAGALIGNLTGGLLQTFLPGAVGVGTILGAIVSKTLDKGSETFISQWSSTEKQQINHDLQAAFRDALVEAIYDIGGRPCFDNQWRNGRDAPAQAVYTLAPLQRQDAALAQQACHLLQKMTTAVKEQKILPLEPPVNEPAANVIAYLQAETPEELNALFFAQVIAPYLEQDEGQLVLSELHSLGFDLKLHLRQRLLDRTLVHLGEFLKARTPAWRAFNRLLLENLRTQLHDLNAGREFGMSAAHLAQVEVELIKLQEILQTSSLIVDLAEWVSAVGQIQKQLDEGFDSLFRRIERDHRETSERLHGLLGATGRLEAKMDRMLLILENGEWEVIGTPSAPLDEPPEPGESPFMGLQYFTEANAHLFFGREMLTARLAGRLRQHRFLAVIGASGSGKSSVVRAGLIPALHRGEPLADGTLPPEGSTDWLVHIITPTAHPLDALAATLTRDAHSVLETTTLLEDLAREPRSLQLHTRKLLSRGDHATRPYCQLLLVVDQFEELFTLCRNEQERSSFIDNLLAAVEPIQAPDVAPEPGGPVVVVIVLRADFYAHCAQYDGLRNALVHYQDYIGPMNEDELRRAIEEPAKQSGWKFERGVVELLLRDVGNEPGALPLLSHALLETWKRRRGRTMVLESYAESGMVRGAIAQTAELVFSQQLTPEQRPLVRNIFLRLTELGESTQDTRRRVMLDELLLTDGKREDVENILRRLVDARLVTTGEDTVELAHEALIREWPTLRQWLAENREWLRIHRHLTEAAQEWLVLARDPGELYRGGRLAQLQEWVGPHWDELNDLEREFLAASQGLAEQEEAEKLARQQRELEQARALAEVERQRAEEQSWATQQLRRRAVLLTGLLVVALLLAIVSVLFGRASNRNAVLAGQHAATAQAASTQAVEQQNIAASERYRAEYQAQVALSRQLAAQASSLAGDLDLGLLLSLQAGRTLPGSHEYRESLLTLLQASSQLTTFLHGHSSIVFDVAVSPDGRLAVSGGQDQTIILWDLASYKPVATLSGLTSWVTTVSFNPDGTILASGGDAVQLWDPMTHTLIGDPFAASEDMIWALAFHPTRPILAVASEDNTITVWSLDERDEPTMLGAPLEQHTNEVRSLAFSPDGMLLASGSWDNTIALWDVSEPAQPALIGSPLQEHTNWVRSIAFHPSGQFLASGSADNHIILWDIRDPANPSPLAPPLRGHSSLVYSVAFSPDGNRLASGGGDKTILLWDVSDPATPESVSPILVGQSAVIQSVAFGPDGRLLSASDDSTIAVWDLTVNQRLARVLRGHTDPVTNVAFSPDGTLIASTSRDGSVRLWDTRDANEPRPLGEALQLEPADELYAVAFSSNGRMLAAASNSGAITLWDLAVPESPQLLGAPLTSHTDRVWALAFHPIEPILASASSDTTVRLWDVSDPAEVKPLGEPLAGHGDWATSLAFSADGAILATGGGDNLILLWDMHTHERKATLGGHSWRVWGLDFSPVSNLLASGGQDSFLILWDIDQILASAQPVDPVEITEMMPSFAQSFTNHANTIATVAFNSNGTMLASAGVEQRILLLDVAARLQLGPPLTAHTGAVVSSAFSPNREWLATAGYDNAIILWDLRLATWQKLACRIANRNLTPAEWTQYMGSAPYEPMCPVLSQPLRSMLP